MDGPSQEFRGYLAEQLEAMGKEDDVERLLAEIADQVHGDIAGSELDRLEPVDLIAAVETWTALASHVVARFYAPASPWRGGLAGWGKKIAHRLRQIANTLLKPLEAAAAGLGASSWSIGVNFPWGVSVGLTWT